MPESKDPLADLQRKIDEAKPHPGMKEQGSSPADIGRGMRFAVELVSGIFVGGALGYLLDRWFGMTPLFLVVGFFLGAAAGFRNIIRAVKEDKE